mmetsp:Transcript_19026/g.50473  ORF Transcript_19026/g.50473 Transcript_19026/m.50473 type:complete len:287 (-) Transcript_19026:96-956(-)
MLEKASKAVFEDFYEVLRVLGQGNFACVLLCRDKRTDQLFAAKKMKKGPAADPKQYQYILRELRVMRCAMHPNVIHALDIFDTREEFTLVMKYYPGGTLASALERARRALTEDEARATLRDVLSGVRFLHAKRIVHRDIKLVNILVERPEFPFGVVLADFGLSNFLDWDNALSSAVGTPMFAAPEVIEGRDYGTEIDMWSTGIVFFALLTGEMPFQGDSEGLYDGILGVAGDEAWRGKLERFSPEARDLCLRLLDRDTATRITAIDAMDHPFFYMLEDKEPEPEKF